MALTHRRWPGITSTLLLVIGALGSASAARVAPGLPPLPGDLRASASGTGLPSTVSSDLRPTFQLRGYSPSDHFTSPEGVAIDARHRILYVADTGKGRVVGFSLQGLPKFVLKVDGISAPKDLAVDKQGRLFVTDKESPLIRAVDAQGKVVLRIDLSSAGIAGPPRLRGLAIDSQGRLYVGDQSDAQVLVCDTDGHVLSRFGTRGDQPGQFKMIEDVALDRVGRVYVVDSVGVPVNVFDPRGKFIFRFGRISSNQGDLRSPVAVFIDRHDQLWVVDEDGHSVQVFDGRGFPLRVFGGDAPGTIAPFLFPSAVALDDLGSVYVVEKGANQVQVFALSRPFLPFNP